MKKFLGIILCLVLLTGCQGAKLENGEESVVKFDKGGISAQELFDVLKEKYGTEELITLIDTELLSKEYKTDSEEKAYIKDVVSYLKEQWKDDYETNMKSYYNVDNEKDLEEYIRLMYRKDKWQKDYAKSEVTDTEINDYYDTVTIGDIEASHILIKVNSEEDEAAALEKAKSIIEKLNNGEDFASLAKEYSEDAANASNGGSLGKFNAESNYDENFLEAAVKLEVGKYTTEPVKSQFGYHIILKTAQDDKPELDKIKETIVEQIATEKVANDPTYMTKAIKALREKYSVKITDKNLKKEYNKIYE